MELKEKIDVNLLPENAKKELLDFYEYLLDKYVKKKKNISEYAGILEKLPIEPMEYQNSIRDEWE